MRTIWWDAGRVRLIDQTRLPHELAIVVCETVDELASAIRGMRVRGAPALGVAAAFGIALAAVRSEARDGGALLADLAGAGRVLRATRPTAVNLSWGVEQMLSRARQLAGADVPTIRQAVVNGALALAEADERACRALGRHGADLVPDGGTVLTHCNAGALAAVAYGTALGVLRAAWEQGKRFHVLVDETRPFLQGARLTAWELVQEGIPATLITDGMAAHFLKAQVQAVVVGADRIAANGDVANKIGTYGVAVVAKENGVPFYVAAPTSTVDLSVPTGEHIPIEERSPDEVVHVAGVRIAPAGVAAAHPAFDVTPARYVTAIITERGIARAPYADSLRRLVES
ncbi:MAG: S-methyl-5-thioribose-1-phosphate isomerase [Chloroflexi bacterium]|nr:S-methyl-5-thioribose-1-phosphate isomerase [Chloroflexota bacterium]